MWPAVGAAVVTAACGGREIFVCTSSAQCIDDRVGFCQPSHVCSFADQDCASGQRYVDHAPSDLAGACVVGDSITGLVVRLGFDEGSGTEAFDASGTDSHAILDEAVDWTEGVSGQAVSFDDPQAIAVVPGASTIFGASSFSGFAWVRSRDTDGVQSRIFGRGFDIPGPGGYLFLSFGNGEPFLESQDSIGSYWGADAEGTGAADGEWHFVGFVVDREAGTSTEYVDGEMWTSSTESTGIFGDETTDQALEIGGQNRDSRFAFAGLIDELWIFARALAPEDVALLYAVGE